MIGRELKAGAHSLGIFGNKTTFAPGFRLAQIHDFSVLNNVIGVLHAVVDHNKGLRAQEAVDRSQFFQVMDRRRLPVGPVEIEGIQIEQGNTEILGLRLFHEIMQERNAVILHHIDLV